MTTRVEAFIGWVIDDLIDGIHALQQVDGHPIFKHPFDIFLQHIAVAVVKCLLHGLFEVIDHFNHTFF